GDGDGDLQLDRLLGEARPQNRFCLALLAISFQRISRQRGSEEDQIVKARHGALGAQPADLVQPEFSRVLDVRDDRVVERSAFFEAQRARHNQYSWSASTFQ